MNRLSRALTGGLVLLAAAWWCWSLNTPPEHLLIGTWKSNHELTSRVIRPFISDVPVEAQDKFLSIFGRMTVTYTAETMHTVTPAMNGFPVDDKTLRYRVKQWKANEMILDVFADSSADPVPMTLRFESRDRYWVDLKPDSPMGIDMTGWRECFERQK